jgi:hypothetical protein
MISSLFSIDQIGHLDSISTTLIGAAYVDGIMNGEVIQSSGAGSETIIKFV